MSSSIKTWPKSERPRERLRQFGAAALSDCELLAILIGTGNPKRRLSPLDLGRVLVSRAGGLGRLEQMPIEEMRHISGLGLVKCCRILAAVELSRRLQVPSNLPSASLDHPRKVHNLLKGKLSGVQTEVLHVLCLNPQLALIAQREVAKGSVEQVAIKPRDVFSLALRVQASGIVVVHNHPSGELDPSPEDVALTKRLGEAGALLGIELIDHLIFTERGYYSFCEGRSYVV